MLEKSKKCLSALYLLDYNNKNQTGYKASAFAPNYKDINTIPIESYEKYNEKIRIKINY